MASTESDVRLASGTDEIAAALDLRHRVFCGEQGVTVQDELDGRDGEALHIVALRGPAVVGTCRLVFDGATARLGRMAVEAGERGRGLGAQLLGAAIAEAEHAGAQRIGLNAQVGAQSLYARAGFAARGEQFWEAGIEHISMEKRLDSGSFGAA